MTTSLSCATWRKTSSIIETLPRSIGTSHRPTRCARPERGAPSGREAVRTYIAAYLGGFPDLHISIDQLLAVGDKVVGVFTFTGTHKGDLFGVTPSGRTIAVRQIAIYRLEGGQVVDEWEISDQLRLMQQIGAHAG